MENFNEYQAYITNAEAKEKNQQYVEATALWKEAINLLPADYHQSIAFCKQMEMRCQRLANESKNNPPTNINRLKRA